MDKFFQNKVALVTGGSFGIGRATAIAFAREGAKVIIADWVEDTDNITLNQIKEEGGEGLFIRCDVSSTNDVNSMIQKCMKKYGRLDYAFNNAGIEGIQAMTHECTEQNWDNTVNVNLKGVWLCMKSEIPLMLENGKGVIINCASVAGLNGFPGLPAYVATKHAIVGLTKTAALEYGKRGIRVNAVCPGVIHTDMIDRLKGKEKELEKQFTSMEPIGRMGNPEEVAATVIWLCSDAASFITGIALPVDGGFVAQ